MIDYRDNPKLMMAMTLQKKCSPKEKVVYICDVPTIVPKNKLELWMDSAINFLLRRNKDKNGNNDSKARTEDNARNSTGQRDNV